MRISFLPHAREVTTAPGATVEEVARAAGLPVSFACGGRGFCGACKVKFVQGAPEPCAWDRMHIPTSELHDGVRLGCLAHLREDAIISGPRQGPPLYLEERTWRYRLSPPAQRAIIRATAQDVSGELGTVLPAAALQHAPRELTLHVLEDQLRKVELGARRSRHLGVAACPDGDAVMSWLLDLETGQELASAATALIGWTGSNTSTADSLHDATRRLVRSLSISAQTRSEDVADVALLATEQSSDDGVQLRNIGAGADALVDAACASAVAASHSDHESVLLLSVSPVPWALCTHNGQGWLASAPGWTPDPSLFAPALTGGAVARVAISGDVELDTNAGATGGITLSGALDCISELRRLEIVDSRGRLVTDAGRITGLPDRVSARLLTGPGRQGFDLTGTVEQPGVVLTQRHIRAIQWLRAVMVSMQHRLFREADIAVDQLEQVVLVGREAAGFRIKSALALGLIPAISSSFVQALPYATGIGVRLAVLSSEANQEIRHLAASCIRIPEAAAEGAWAEGLYLDRTEGERAHELDAEARALIDFPQRGSVGIGRRA